MCMCVYVCKFKSASYKLVVTDKVPFYFPLEIFVMFAYSWKKMLVIDKKWFRVSGQPEHIREVGNTQFLWRPPVVW